MQGRKTRRKLQRGFIFVYFMPSQGDKKDIQNANKGEMRGLDVTTYGRLPEFLNWRMHCWSVSYYQNKSSYYWWLGEDMWMHFNT